MCVWNVSIDVKPVFLFIACDVTVTYVHSIFHFSAGGMAALSLAMPTKLWDRAGRECGRTLLYLQIFRQGGTGLSQEAQHSYFWIKYGCRNLQFSFQQEQSLHDHCIILLFQQEESHDSFNRSNRSTVSNRSHRSTFPVYFIDRCSLFWNNLMSDQSELNFQNPASDKRMSHLSCKFSQLYCSPFFSVGMFGVFCTTDTLHIPIR